MRLSAVVAVSALTMTFPVLASCGDALSQAAETLAPQQVSLVHATCREVMGLAEGQAEFDGCVDSLSQTLAQTLAFKVRDELALKSYGDCEHAGLLRDTPQFSDCVLNRQSAYAGQLKQEIQAQGTGVPPVRLAYDSDGSKDAGASFFESGFAERHRKEEYSCAQLSLELRSSPFTQCVADLDRTILNREHRDITDFDIEHPLDWCLIAVEVVR